MLVAGGALGVAGHAQAATNEITYDYSGTASPQNVNIFGTTEYQYGAYTEPAI